MPTMPTQLTWRQALPVLTGRAISLREPTLGDCANVSGLLAARDASRFGIEEPMTDVRVMQFVDRAVRERSAGLSFAYLMTHAASLDVIGLIQVRQLDPAFETAEWEGTIAPGSRGTGAFLDAARLVGSFVFGTVGAHRIECRVPVQNGRANGALRKLGAVEEGVLRRSLRRRGSYVDQVLWSLLKDDWGDLWTATAARVH